MPAKKRLVRSDLKHASVTRGRHIHGRCYSLMISALPHAVEPRSTCVISKKTAARAVDRNTAKRKCREAVRDALNNVKSPHAFIFRIKPPALTARKTDLEREIASLVKEALQYAK